MLSEMSHSALQVFEQQPRKIAAQSKARQNSLYYETASVGRHWIGGDLPSSHSQPVRQVVQRKAWLHAFLDCPGTAWNSAAAVVYKVEHFQPIDLIRKPGAYVCARLGNPCITVTAQTHEVVVLGRDLASRPREVQSERRHVTAQVFHAEDQVFRQVVRFSPNGPAAA